MKVQVQELSRHFGAVKAVDGVSFAFGEGEVVGFVGPNGAGKTTAMRIMATLDEPTWGDVFFDGRSVQDYPEYARRHLGFMPDALPEHADMTAHEYVDFFGRAFGLKGKALHRAVDEVESFTGIGPIRDKTLRALSKGMKQRVSLARALVHDPALLIMDEPANGLDPRARIELRELVKILAENGKTILISSHILSELAEMCTGVVILERGKLLSDGTRGVKSAEPAHQTVRLLIRVLDPTPDELAKRLLELPQTLQATVRGNACAVEIAGGDDEAAALLAELVSRRYRVADFRIESLRLEDIFMAVTKGDLA